MRKKKLIPNYVRKKRQTLYKATTTPLVYIFVFVLSKNIPLARALNRTTFNNERQQNIMFSAIQPYLRVAKHDPL